MCLGRLLDFNIVVLSIFFYGHGGDLVRVEFGTPHRNAGMITFYENGEHVRSEYTDGREVAHFEGGMLLRVVRNAGAGAGRNPDDPEGESRYVHPHRIVGSPAGAPADHAGAGGAGAPQHSGDAVLLYESGKLARIEYGNGNETAGISETTEPSGPAGAKRPAAWSPPDAAFLCCKRPRI